MKNDMNEAVYTLPPEWAPQSAVMLTWPHADTDWAPCLEAVTQTYVAMAAAISEKEPLLVVAPQAAPVVELLSARLDGRQMARVVVFECPTDDTWARDHGFITLLPAAGSPHAAPRLLDFRFNGWGEKFAAERDNAINRRLYEAGIVHGEYVGQLDFVLEGGAIESDGRGTVFTTSQCLLAPHRNQPLDRSQIEQRLKRSLGARRVVWIDHGTLQGDDTDGHIDTTVRVAPGDTLLYVGCDDERDEHYADFKALECQLAGLTTLDGRPYRLLRLPMPDALFDPDDGSRLPATYANFLVMNGRVLVPTYGQPGKDAEAMGTVARAFPDREVVGIDSQTLVRQHGSLHCCTMQLPEGVLRPCGANGN